MNSVGNCTNELVKLVTRHSYEEESGAEERQEVPSVTGGSSMPMRLRIGLRAGHLYDYN